MAPQTPEVSVVVPTHNRVDSLCRVLIALQAQTYPRDRFEVVVVIDGSTDGTAATLAAHDWGDLRLRVIEQPQSGVAVARNTGAQSATAPLLVYLDDDVTPVPGLVAAFAAQQAASGPCVAIGRLAPALEAQVPGWTRWIEWQLAKQYAAMQRGDRPIDGRALYSGNFCLPRDVFSQLGGFSTDQPYCEDTDLGVRLQRAGYAFVLCPEASGHHGGVHGYDSWQATAYRDGAWDAELALKLTYPYSWQELLRDFDQRQPVVRLLARALLDHRRLFWLSIRGLRLLASLAGSLRLSPIQRRLYGGIYNLVYWQGVCDALGGAGLLRRYLDQPHAIEAGS